MKNTLLKTAAFVAVFAFALSVNAQEAKKDAGERFKKFDTNKDGSIDKTEAAAVKDGKLARAFPKIDTNKDGLISMEEMKAFKAQKMAAKGGRTK
jgi:Ca2+-binding EF-hand superfamily protein